MKILISIGTLGLGGAEKQAVWLANRLSELHEVTLLTYRGGVREKDLSPKVTWKTIYETQDEEKNEEIDFQGLIGEERVLPQSLIKMDSNPFFEVGNRERKSVTSISRLSPLEEKVKTSLKNFPLTFKLLRFLYIKCMPLIQFIRSGTRLSLKSLRKFKSGLTWKNFSKRFIRLVFELIEALMRRFSRLMRKPRLYLKLSTLWQNIKNQTYVFRRARKIVKEVRPDLIVTFLFHDTLNVGLAGLTQTKRPKLIVGRRSPIGYGDNSRNYFHKLALKVVYRFADLAVSNSSGNLEAALHDGLTEDKINIVHNFIKNDNSKLRLNDSNEIHLICIANFFDYKNHLGLIKALGQINNQFTYRVTFLGDGPLLSEMISLAKSLNLTADFFSHEDQAKISEFKVDFLLLPSFFEGSSNALLESLAEGIPAIVTNVGLVPELKEMGAPLVVSSGTDIKSLKIALQNGLNFQHDLKVQAQNFKGIAEKEFGEVKVLQDWLQLIEKL